MKLSDTVPVEGPGGGHNSGMDTHIKLRALGYADLVELGKLAAEAMELSQEYDRSRAGEYCKLIAACNGEVLARREQAKRRCGTATD